MKKKVLFLIVIGLLVSLTAIQAQPTEEIQKILASDGAESDYFGGSVSISGDYAIVGAYFDDDNGNNSGSAYIYYNNAGTWEQQAKLTASDGATNDLFGFSVSISNDYAIVGAYGDDDNGSGSGSAYIYYNNAGTWEQQAKLTASDGVDSDIFGSSVSISNDYAIVGARGDDDNGSASGSAYIFYNNAGTWEQQAKLIASDGDINDNFGIVSISNDYAIVGAFGDADNGYNSGSAYIFYKDQGGANNWGQQTKLTAADGAFDDKFGYSVSISNDYAIVGAFGDADNGSYSGSAYIYYNNAGTWGQQAKLTASDGAENDYFGISISISNDYAVVGAYQNDNNGSAYIFYKDQGGTNNWGQQKKITASDGDEYDFFGKSVSIYNDYAVVGANGDDDNGSASGSAYIFGPPPPPMELVFTTTEADTEIELPLYGTVTCTVDWGDGSDTEDFTTSGNYPHTFATAGTYTVTISGELTKFGNGSSAWTGAEYLTEVVDFGEIGLTSLSGAFYNADNLTSVPAVFPSIVTDLSYAFYSIDQVSITNLNLWNVESVINMYRMFYNATAFNQDISDWNVAEVITMREMFYGATAFNQDIGATGADWDVSKVTNMRAMFAHASAFNGNIGNWNVASVTN